eukprot:TRINITY_DN3860_c0_g1_i1.p1 TRINITY_DN3860_c0_g1~~TRINITY_DN3860_c0_g1_i1.p1  ORF type:complete len:603 (+),score=132.10 TRINITY_DN3860_c0_g1_i1:246-2054(+)
MLGLPHHARALNATGATKGLVNVTTVWTVKGNMSVVRAARWVLPYALDALSKGFGDELRVPPERLASVKSALRTEAAAELAEGCPGDFEGVPGILRMELYAYGRALSRSAQLAAIARSVSDNATAARLTERVARCVEPLLRRPEKAPWPCPPPVNGSFTCPRNMTDVFYDRKWGGLITTWYDQFANHYCQCDKPGSDKNPGLCVGSNYCDNVNGWDAFSNYGNPFYNDHHLQYGYVVHAMAWVLYASAHEFIPRLPTETFSTMRTTALLFAREYANPDPAADSFFPFLRHKDLFDGHSWAEGYSFNGRINMWVNQQSGGEALHSYYAVAMLGLALGDANTAVWGALHAATEAESISTYQLLSNESNVPLPDAAVANSTRCLSILKGNAVDGATYFGPNYVFECGIVLLPLSPMTSTVVSKSWAAEASEWLQWHHDRSGVCTYPAPELGPNPCSGTEAAAWYGNKYQCCPVMSPASAVPESGPPKCDIVKDHPALARTPPQATRSAAHTFAPRRPSHVRDAVGDGVQIHKCNQWRVYPDWLPMQYFITSLANRTEGLQLLTAIQDYKPNPPLAPFPYFQNPNSTVVTGYAPSLSRCATLVYSV